MIGILLTVLVAALVYLILAAITARQSWPSSARSSS